MICPCKPKLIISTEVDAASDFLNITIPPTNFNNHERFCLVIAQNIPNDTVLPVMLINGSVKMTLHRRTGNFVRSDQLRTRRVYSLNVASTPPLATVCSNNLCCSAFVQPQVLGEAAPAAARSGGPK